MTKALVVGSGVGGLTAAVALRRVGIEVEVFERAAEPGLIRVGGGLHVWPNGMRALREVGLAEQVEVVGKAIARLDWFSPDGLLASADLAATARLVGAPSVGVRRADLLAILLEAVGEESIRFGADLAGLEQDARAVTVRFADGSEESGDVLIAADGLHSTVRRELVGETELRSPGVLVCQATAEAPGPVSPSAFAETWGPNMRFGCYPVRDGVFWFAFLRSSEAEALRTAGPRELLLARTQSWIAPARDVIAATPADAVGWGEVVARDPLERWSKRRVTLLGDAAHPMTPFTGQGACQAIEDAVVLAACLGAEPDVAAALRLYETRRIPRTTEIWRRSWAAARSAARKSRTIEPARRRVFAATFERVVWKQLEDTIAHAFLDPPARVAGPLTRAADFEKNRLVLRARSTRQPDGGLPRAVRGMSARAEASALSESAPDSDRYDVVVIGSGLAGLSAAALLAKAGRSLLVVEQGEAAGGYAHGFERGPYRFDPAVHVFPQGEPGGLPDRLFDFLGVGDLVTLLPVGSFFKAVYPGLTFDAPRGYAEFSAALGEVFPAEAAAIRSFVRLCEKVHWQGHNQPPRLEMADLPRAERDNPELFQYVRATAAEVLDEYFDDPRLKSLLGALWPYLAVPPSRVSAVTYLTMLSLFLQGASYSRGTFESFVKALTTAIERHGGEVRANTAATKIAVEGGRVVGVELNGGERIRAPVVISNADALSTFEHLVGEEHLPRRFMNKMRRMRPSLSAVVVFAATSLDLRALGAAHEIFRNLSFDHDQSYRDVLDGRPGGMWGSVPTLVDDSLAPEGEHALTLTSLAPYDIGKPWETELKRFTSEMLDAFEEVFPGLRDSLTFVESASPLTLERRCGNQRGAIYGWENIPAQSGGRRAPHETAIEGLILAGHWTQPGTGSIRVIVSGMHAAELALRSTGSPDGTGFQHPDYPPV